MADRGWSPDWRRGRPRLHNACSHRGATGIEPKRRTDAWFIAQRHALGKAEAQEGPMTTVWIYVDTRCHPGHPAHLKVFANPVAADEWFKENDPEASLSSMRFWSEARARC